MRDTCYDCSIATNGKYECNPCTIRNRKGIKAAAKKIKQAVFNHYGLKCACCGEDDLGFLTIDHVDGGGTKQRRADGTEGEKLYRWLKKNKFPVGFQTLCFNCNCGRSRNGGICPHKLRGVDQLDRSLVLETRHRVGSSPTTPI